MDSSDIWAELGSDTRAALGWAAAMESRDVGTRTLLIGIIRNAQIHDPEELLRVFGCPKSRLFDALQQVAPQPKIWPYAAQPAQLEGVPSLSPNGKLALERAVLTRNSIDRTGPVTARHLFAALLDLRRSTAYRGLRAVLDADVSEIRNLYLEFLRAPDVMTFRERLVKRYPDRDGAWSGALRGQKGPVNALSFSPLGKQLASAGADSTVRLWNLAGDLDPVLVVPKTVAEQTALAYSPDGLFLVSGSSSGTVWLWDLSGSEVRLVITAVEDSHRIQAIAFSPQNFVAIGNAGGGLTIRTTNLELLANNAAYLEHSDRGGITALAYSADGKRLVSADQNGVIALWDPLTCDKLAEHLLADRAVLALSLAPAGTQATVVFEDGSIGSLDLDQESVRIVATSLGGPLPVTAALSRDASLAAIALQDDAIFTAPTDGTSPPLNLGSHIGRVGALAVSADATLIASGGKGGEIEIWESGENRPRDDAVDWQLDSASQGVKRDALGRTQLAKSLAQRLRQIDEADAEESFLLHVDGPWGSGKSTVLGLLEQQLRGDEERWLVVGFDAWRQSRVGPPWWALLTSLRATQRQASGRFGAMRLRLAETAHRLRQNGLSLLLTLIVLAVAVTAFLLLGPVQGSVAGGVQLISATIAVLTTIWLLARAAAGSFMWESATGARLYEQAHHEPMEGLAKHFAWLMGRPQGRVVFFIDDLDRCDERYVVDLLDSIQTLVRDAPSRSGASGSKPPYFVVAADGRWIRCSYEHVYGTFELAVREPGRSLGHLFLDKIFQLTVRVPTIGPEQQRAYLNHLLRRFGGAPPGTVDADLREGKRKIRESRSQGEVLEVLEEAPEAAQPELRAAAVEQLATQAVSEETEHELQKFAGLLEPNPRSMKRFVNAYSVALSTALLEERTVEPDQLGLWTILRMRWPDLAVRLAMHPELLRDLADNGAAPAGTPESVEPLFADPMVREVVAFGERPLDAEAVRQLA